MDEKKCVYMVIMESNDDDYGPQYETEIFAEYEDALAYWEKHVNIELHDENMSWVAEVYNDGDYDTEQYELSKSEGHFVFEERGWDKFVSWSIEEKEVH